MLKYSSKNVCPRGDNKCIKCLKSLEYAKRMELNVKYTLYIGNNITKFDHLSLNIRQNNRYYRFGSYILNISSKFVEFLRTNTFCRINTRNVRENGRQATYY